MSYPIYYVPAGDVLPIMFSTYGKTNGESITMSGLAVTDIEIYKDGSTTQRASDAGYTLLDTDGIDFDSITGIHGFSIDTGDNTDAGFYTVGAWYHVVVSSVTVDSQTVSFIAAAFRIMAAEDAAGVPDVNVTHFGGSAGTFSGGRPEVNTSHISGSAVSTTSAQIGVNVVQISTDAAAADNLEAALDGTGGVTITAALTGNVTGNLSGSVGSVTGNVGGSVASVTAGVTVTTNNDKTGYSIGTGGIAAASFAAGAIDNAAIAADAIGASEIAADAIGSSELAATAAAEIADALLGRNVAGGSDGGRTVKQALYALRNRVAIGAGTMTVYQTDDTTSEWTAAVTTAAGDPISEVNPT